MRLSHQCDNKGNKREKNYISKVRGFRCREMGHFAMQCPRKKGKEEKSDPKVALAQADKEDDEDCAMSARAPLEKRWGDIELQLGGLQIR